MKIVTFGEIMLRLCPPEYGRFVSADSFRAVYGGAEANTAVCLSNLGADTSFVTRLPQHEIGQAAVNALRRYGVDTSGIVRGGNRIGIYFLERGAAVRSSKVIYDRAGSSAATARRSDFNWDKLLRGAQLFHFTGITPALGGELPDICADALAACRRLGVATSVDVNYRSALWSEKQAGETIGALIDGIDLCIVNEEHASKLFGITTDKPESDKTRYLDIAREVAKKFGCKNVAVTIRRTISSDENTISALYYNAASYIGCFSREYTLRMVDRVGGGDSFAAGLIYAKLSGMTQEDAVEFAEAASALKHTVEGDFNLVTKEEVLKLMSCGPSGRLNR